MYYLVILGKPQLFLDNVEILLTDQEWQLFLCVYINQKISRVALADEIWRENTARKKNLRTLLHNIKEKKPEIPLLISYYDVSIATKILTDFDNFNLHIQKNEYISAFRLIKKEILNEISSDSIDDYRRKIESIIGDQFEFIKELFFQGKLLECLEIIEKMYKIGFTDNEIIFLYAKILFRLQKRDIFVSFYEKLDDDSQKKEIALIYENFLSQNFQPTVFLSPFKYFTLDQDLIKRCLLRNKQSDFFNYSELSIFSQITFEQNSEIFLDNLFCETLGYFDKIEICINRFLKNGFISYKNNKLLVISKILESYFHIDISNLFKKFSSDEIEFIKLASLFEEFFLVEEICDCFEKNTSEYKLISEKLLEHQIIIEKNSGYVFLSKKFKFEVYKIVDYKVKKHLKIIRYLEKNPEKPISVLAFHYNKANNNETALDLYEQAAMEFRDKNLNKEAVNMYEKAILITNKYINLFNIYRKISEIHSRNNDLIGFENAVNKMDYYQNKISKENFNLEYRIYLGKLRFMQRKYQNSIEIYSLLDFNTKIDPEITFFGYLFYSKSLIMLKRFADAIAILEKSLKEFDNIHSIIKGDSYLALYEALEGSGKKFSRKTVLNNAKDSYNKIGLLSGVLRVEYKIISMNENPHENCLSIEKILNENKDTIFPLELRIRFLILGIINCLEIKNDTLSEKWNNELMEYFPINNNNTQQFSQLSYYAYFNIAAFFRSKPDFLNAKLAIDKCLSIPDLSPEETRSAKALEKEIKKLKMGL